MTRFKNSHPQVQEDSMERPDNVLTPGSRGCASRVALRLFHNQVQLSVTQRVKNQFLWLPFILFLLVSTTSWDNVCKGILHKNHYLTKYQYFITNTLMTILALKMIHMRLFINLNESYLLNYRELESYIKQSIP